MWLFFSIATALLWGTAELFYKKGAQPNEKYSHLKICVWVGVVMGAHAIFTLLTQDIGYNPVNQIVGYIMSGDPTYITSHNNARSLIMKVERDELVEELLTQYIKNHNWK